MQFDYMSACLEMIDELDQDIQASTIQNMMATESAEFERSEWDSFLKGTLDECKRLYGESELCKMEYNTGFTPVVKYHAFGDAEGRPNTATAHIQIGAGDDYAGSVSNIRDICEKLRNCDCVKNSGFYTTIVPRKPNRISISVCKILDETSDNIENQVNDAQEGVIEWLKDPYGKKKAATELAAKQKEFENHQISETPVNIDRKEWENLKRDTLKLIQKLYDELRSNHQALPKLDITARYTSLEKNIGTLIIPISVRSYTGTKGSEWQLPELFLATDFVNNCMNAGYRVRCDIATPKETKRIPELRIGFSKFMVPGNEGFLSELMGEVKDVAKEKVKSAFSTKPNSKKKRSFDFDTKDAFCEALDKKYMVHIRKMQGIGIQLLSNNTIAAKGFKKTKATDNFDEHFTIYDEYSNGYFYINLLSWNLGKMYPDARKRYPNVPEFQNAQYQICTALNDYLKKNSLPGKVDSEGDWDEGDIQWTFTYDSVAQYLPKAAAQESIDIISNYLIPTGNIAEDQDQGLATEGILFGENGLLHKLWEWIKQFLASIKRWFMKTFAPNMMGSYRNTKMEPVLLRYTSILLNKCATQPTKDPNEDAFVEWADDLRQTADNCMLDLQKIFIMAHDEKYYNDNLPVNKNTTKCLETMEKLLDGITKFGKPNDQTHPNTAKATSALSQAIATFGRAIESTKFSQRNNVGKVEVSDVTATYYG